MFSFLSTYDDAVKAIIMPPRQEYTSADLGPIEFNVKNNIIKRTDLRLRNKRGLTLECSFYHHKDITEALPCIIYLHANGCCRLEPMQYVEHIMVNKVNFFTFDFTACGKSDGMYSSVGWHEQDDIEAIVEYLFNTGKVSKISLWGRSMGAVAAILYSKKDSRITSMVLDSPFSNFKELVIEVAKKKVSLPGFLTSGLFNFLKGSVQKKANFDLDDLSPIDYVKHLRQPSLFGAAIDDNFVPTSHSKELYSSYPGPKQIFLFEGDHNSQRPVLWVQKVIDFLKQNLMKVANKETPTKTYDSPQQKVKPKQSSPRRMQNKMMFSWLEQSHNTLSFKNLPPSANNPHPLQLRADSGANNRHDTFHDENIPVEPSIESETRAPNVPKASMTSTLKELNNSIHTPRGQRNPIIKPIPTQPPTTSNFSVEDESKIHASLQDLRKVLPEVRKVLGNQRSGGSGSKTMKRIDYYRAEKNNQVVHVEKKYSSEPDKLVKSSVIGTNSTGRYDPPTFNFPKLSSELFAKQPAATPKIFQAADKSPRMLQSNIPVDKSVEAVDIIFNKFSASPKPLQKNENFIASLGRRESSYVDLRSLKSQLPSTEFQPTNVSLQEMPYLRKFSLEFSDNTLLGGLAPRTKR